MKVSKLNPVNALNNKQEPNPADGDELLQDHRRGGAACLPAQAPEYFTAPGYDFPDVTAELDEMAPRTDASAQRKIADYADEKDAEDARETMATRADFMRDQQLTG